MCFPVKFAKILSTRFFHRTSLVATAVSINKLTRKTSTDIALVTVMLTLSKYLFLPLIINC